MSDQSNMTLKSLINDKLLMDAEHRMTKLLDISIVTVDPDGAAIGEIVNPTPFIKLLCSTEKGKRLYSRSNKVLCEKLKRDRTCRVYECQIGFKCCIAPVIVEDLFLGAVIIGQFFSEDEKYKKNQLFMKKISDELQILEQEIKDSVQQLPVVSEKRVMNFIECSEFLSGYFSELAIKGITEKKLVHETMEKMKFEEEAEKAQLKTLGAQINPHFLFNTLNSITRMAYMENSPKTEEMIYCLSDLLRYSIKQSEEFPTIGSELQNIMKYLFIQSIRYKDRLKYSVNIPEELMSYRIPAMILQPIVENAIVHGLEPKPEGGDIYITSETNGEKIKILVKDTGVGIPLKTIGNLLGQDAESSRGLGIYSSHQRLNTYFGSDYGLKIYSNENIETTVEINFPCFKEISPINRN